MEEEKFEPKELDLTQFIPYIGRHIEGWKDVKGPNDATIFRLSGLSNITCLVKAREKSIQPRYIIFRKFSNELCESEIEGLVFKTLSEEGLGPTCYFQNDEYRLEESFDARPLTIFEMKNPLFLSQIIEMTFKMNYNLLLKERLKEAKGGHYPTQVEVLRNEWLPKLFSKHQYYLDLTTVEEYREILDLVKQTWLVEDVYDRIDGLSYQMQDNKDTLVVSHNDIQECNVLSMRYDATKLALIDFEYASLGHREYDLANIFCELMTDNAYPYYPFTEIYLQNALSKEEYEKYSKLYLSLYHKSEYKGELSEEDYITQELPTFLQNLYCSMILVGYYWGVWSILMIIEDQINDKVFNFQFAKKRIELTQFLMSHDFIREAVEDKLQKYKESKETSS